MANIKQRAVLNAVGKRLKEAIEFNEKNTAFTNAILNNLEPELRVELADLAEESTDWRVILEKSSIELLKGLEESMLSAQQITEDEAK